MKKKIFWKNFLIFNRLIKEAGKKTIFLIATFSIVSIFLELSSFSLIINYILNTGSQYIIPESLSSNKLLITLLAIISIREFIKIIIKVNSEKLRLEFTNFLREDFLSKILYTKFNNLNKIGRGELLNIFNTEINRSTQSLDQFIKIVQYLITFIIYSLTLIIFGKSSLLPILIAFVATALATFLNKYGAWQLGLKYTELSNKSQKIIGDSLYGFKELRSSAGENWILKKFQENNIKYQKLITKIVKERSIFIGLRDIFLILVFTIWLNATKANLTIKELITILLFSYKAANSLSLLVQSYKFFNINFPGYLSIYYINKKLKNRFFLEKKRKLNHKKFQQIKKISWENPYCSLTKLELDKGSITLITGTSGIGKTTLLNSFAGFTENNNWTIYQGENYSKTNIRNSELINKLISYSPQDSILFEASLEENLLVGNNKSIKEIKRYFKKLGLNSRISNNNFKEELKLTINRFSGGELKKLGLIRAFLKNKNIEIYDEPTAHLDDESSKLVINELLERSEDKIILVASHDMRFEKIAKSIINLN